MRANAKQAPTLTCLILFLICFVFRIAEYLFLRTDQMFLTQAFLHKILGVVVLALALRVLSYSWREIGFRAEDLLGGTLLGLGLGAAVFIVGYGVEFVALVMNGAAPSFELYATGYSLAGNLGSGAGLLAFFLCIVFNMISAFMEEGLFRGLFIRLGELSHSFFGSMLIAAVFFGFWHAAMPVRSFLDGALTWQAALLSGLGYVAVTAVLGIKWGLLCRATGSIWAAMGDHFVGGAIVNLLHVTSLSGADSLQFVRVLVAQTLSFLIVLALYYRSGRRRHIFY